jgi:two-component system NtrC family response regulator
MARKGNFCESLCQRLRPFSMVLPPLRERPEDVLGLTYYHLERYGQAEIDEPCLDAEAQLVIENYPWPGNVTELLEVVSEARRRSGQRQITVEHLPERIVAHVNVESLKKRRQLELAEYKGKALKSFLRDKERDYLKSVMDSVGNREEAAKKLRLDAAGLERHISGSGTR